MPVQREFLGWERPFLGLAVDWLWARRAELPGMLVVVPTAQSGRRLREALAERGACLGPRVVTPGWWLRSVGDGLAAPAVEVAAWAEVLEATDDWEELAAVLPQPPAAGEERGWAAGLARSLAGLRRTLQENALTIAAAARRLAAGEDAGRWQVLALLEQRVEDMLERWGLRSRSAAVAGGLAPLPDAVAQVVLAGVADLPPAVARNLTNLPRPLTVLVGAPAGEAAAFDLLGMPVVAVWGGRELPWPGDDRVEVVADPRQQAVAAVRRLAVGGCGSDEVAVGCADEESAGELVRACGRAGWIAHDPARVRPAAAAKWLAVWKDWLARSDAGTAVDLLGMPETGVLAGGGRAQVAAALSMARDRWLVANHADLARVIPLARENEREWLAGAAAALGRLEAARVRFLGAGVATGLAQLAEAGVFAAGDAHFLSDWLAACGGVVGRLRREPGFWLELLLDDWPPVAAEPPAGRVLDIEGWLELFYEPGRHLVLCGINEGLVPAANAPDSWLTESTRVRLGLPTDAGRAARDAFLFTAMIEARRAGGRVDVLLAKANGAGDPLLPSRLLLGCARERLPARVEAVFRAVEPPDAGLAWQADWRWQPRAAEVPRRISVTALRDYLACPFRFHLKHVLRMAAPDPGRREWNPRDFGTIAHLVLEAWARDPEAREFSKREAIEQWVLDGLDRVVAGRFGAAPPLAVRVQVEGLRQRLRWFANVQACERAAGWRIEEVEKPFELTIGGIVVAGKIDRIDVDRDGNRRVLDYKTRAEVKDVERDHRTRVMATTNWPAHLVGVEAVRCTVVEKGKAVEKRWENLQVALYAATVERVAQLGYFGLGASESEVRLALWDGFGAADRDSALACAEWVVGRIDAGVFGPPAERVLQDDFELLAAGKTLAETGAGERGE